MDLIRLRCTSCGADFENVDVQNQRIFRCTRAGCGAAFMVDQGAKFADIEKEKAEKIEKYRKGLREALDPFQDDRVTYYANLILEMVPDDFRAQCFTDLRLFRDDDGRSLYAFLQNPPPCTDDEFSEVFPSLLKFCDFRGLTLLKDETIPRCVQNREWSDRMLRQVEEQIQVERQKNDWYADVNRDVFICHSSINSDVALQVMTELEKDGNLCWISSRNLPENERHYWPKIESAIARCSIFLVICTDDAMQSHDVQREISCARKNHLERLELKYDTAPHTTLFKDFFNGIAWVDGTGNLEEAISKLKKQVKDLRFPPDPESPVVTVNEPTQEEKDRLREEQRKKEQARLAREEAEREAREEAERQKKAAQEKAAAEKKKKEDEEKKQKEKALREQREKERAEKLLAEKWKRIFRQKRAWLVYTLAAILLFAARVLVSRSQSQALFPSLLQRQMLPGFLYFLAVLAYERILLRHTEKPRFAMGLALLLPLAMDFWYLTGLMHTPDVNFILRVLAYTKALALAASLLMGIASRRKYEKES